MLRELITETHIDKNGAVLISSDGTYFFAREPHDQVMTLIKAEEGRERQD